MAGDHLTEILGPEIFGIERGNQTQIGSTQGNKLFLKANLHFFQSLQAIRHKGRTTDKQFANAIFH